MEPTSIKEIDNNEVKNLLDEPIDNELKLEINNI